MCHKKEPLFFVYGSGTMSEQDAARLQEQIKTLFNDVEELKLM